MQIIIEKIENGYLVVLQNQEGRKVFAASKGVDVVAFVKGLVDPSPIVTQDQSIAVAK